MHEKFNALVQEYIDGELGFIEQLILEKHLANCRACRRELNQMKLMDWDLKHQPVVEVPPELESYRMATLKAHLSDTENIEKESSFSKTWRLQQLFLQHTFSFISFNPANQTINHSVKKSVSFFARVAGKRIKKRKSLLARFIPGQA